MSVPVAPEEIPGVRLFTLRVHRDSRGTFVEQWREDRRDDVGLPAFVQDNAAFSRRGVLRGLHYQHPRGQGKLISAPFGEIFDVFVDLRRGSATFGRWAASTISGDNGLQIYLPPGIAHGYIALSDVVLVTYKCTEYYDPSCDRGLSWADVDIGVDWPIAAPEISPRDQVAPALRDIPAQHLPDGV